MRCKRRCGELQCHEISLRENCRKYRLGAHHCIMFSTTSLKSLPLLRVKFH